MITLTSVLIMNILEGKGEVKDVSELGSWARGRGQGRLCGGGGAQLWIFSSDSPCYAGPASRSPGPGKCASAHGCYFGCSAQQLDWWSPGPGLLTVRPSKEQRHWHWTPWRWNLWEVWAPSFYLLFIPSIQFLMLLLHHKLIFLPHIFQDLNQIFPWGFIHLHIDLEVIWHMLFLHFLFNNRERE